jgi:predicted nucleotidyltransferase
METIETATTTKEVIRQAIEYLLRKIRVHKAILFGSHSRGTADEWSDIDLAVISPDFARMNQKEVIDLLVEVALVVAPSLEIRPYTPQDLKEARPTNFLGHILTEGKVVYTDGEFLLLDEKESSLPLDGGE